MRGCLDHLTFSVSVASTFVAEAQLYLKFSDSVRTVATASDRRVATCMSGSNRQTEGQYHLLDHI